jgi:hypothetical protein
MEEMRFPAPEDRIGYFAKVRVANRIWSPEATFVHKPAEDDGMAAMM